MLPGRSVLGAVALPLILLSFGALAGDGGVYTYNVLLNGQPVGHHQVAFFRHNGRTEIEAVSDVEVRFAFIPVFRFDHHRREVWESGRPVYIAATTDNDGDKYDITVRKSGDGAVRVVNDRTERFDGPIRALTLWNRDIVHYDTFVSLIDDEVVHASFEYQGLQPLSLGGQKIETDHYRMIGDASRDVWFDQAGHVAKVKFWEGGSKIEIVRNEPTWRPLDDRLLAELSDETERR